MDDQTAFFITATRDNRTAALATLLTGAHAGVHIATDLLGYTTGSTGDATLDVLIVERLNTALNRQEAERSQLEHGGEMLELFVDVTTPPARLIIVGAVHAAIALITFGNALGYHTIVVDNRTAFNTPERVGTASERIVQWPADALRELNLDDGSYVVFLTHDPKLDNPALIAALHSPARYIGALGSVRTHARRIESLREEGLSDDELVRIHAPVGLDIGARSPEEIALSIIAEITAVRRGKDVRRKS